MTSVCVCEWHYDAVMGSLRQWAWRMCVLCQVVNIIQLDKQICQARHTYYAEVTNVEDLTPGSSTLS